MLELLPQIRNAARLDLSRKEHEQIDPSMPTSMVFKMEGHLGVGDLPSRYLREGIRRMNRIRFSLRTMLIAMSLASLAFGAICFHVRNLNRIAADIEMLRNNRTNVDVGPLPWKFVAFLTPKFSGYPTNVRKYSDTPKLQDVDQFIDVIVRNPTVTSLTIDGTALDDTQVQRILGLPLASLSISQCSTGDTLDCRVSKSIEWLGFQRTRLNDRSLFGLGDLPALRHLDLTRTRVTDDSIAYLSKLPALKTLIVRRCGITESGRMQLAALRPDLDVRWEPLRH